MKHAYITESYFVTKQQSRIRKCHKLSLSVLIVFDQTQRVHLEFETDFQISDIDAFYNIPS